MSRVLPARVRQLQAFTLVEVTLALGIAVFCLVVIFGLLNVGLNTSSASIEQTNASNILGAVAADLRAAPTPPTNGASTVYGLQLPTNVAMGGNTPAPAANPTYTKTLDVSGQPVTTSPPGRYQLDVWTMASVNRDATRVRLRVSWPPGATVPAGSIESVVSLDRN